MDLQDIKLLRSGIKRLLNTNGRHGLREKQVQAFRALVSDKFTDEQIAHSYFKLPTGFGKTVMFSTMARAYFDAVKAAGDKRQKIIIIVPRLSLINQTKEKLDKFADLVATEYSGRVKDNKSDIIITTYNSLGKLFGTVDFYDVGLIFADEAHHMLGKNISEQLSFYNNFIPIIGFTATPEYEFNHAVANMLNTEIFAMDIPDSIEANILSPVKNVLYRSSIVCDLSEMPVSSNGEFDYEKITTKISPDTLATEIARIYAEGIDENTGIEFKNLKAIINCPNAEIANLQAAKINEIMGKEIAISLHKVGIGNKKYDCLQQDFINGKYTVACQVGTMTEGFDDVTVSMCINYPTRSRVKAEQTAGRIIRIDKKNQNKIAFVIDTIFQSTPNEEPEDILYTASKARQVLFKDIVGKMVLLPKDSHKRLSQHNKQITRNSKKIKFVDFELITDNTTLIELNNRTNKRISTEIAGEKTDEWQSAHNLAKDPSFPIGSFDNIKRKLQELQYEMPEFIQIRLSENHQKGLCLHRDGRQMFLEKIGFQDYPQKTQDWQSAYNLAKDRSFPINESDSIKVKLQELQPEMPEFIQIRKPKTGVACLCLHRDSRQLFLKKIGFKEYSIKTEDWQSSHDLAKDPSFPMGNIDNIKRKLEELQPEMPEFIQIRKSKTGGRNALFLHRNGREVFLKKTGIRFSVQKTEDWQNALDLSADKTFPFNTTITISKKLKELQPEMPEFIQIRKPKKGADCLCLHRDGRQMFLEKIGFQDYPPKTKEWLSAHDLSADKTFPMVQLTNISKKLQKLQPEMPEFIQIRISINHQKGLCLHRDGREEFLRRVQEIKTKSMKHATINVNTANNAIETSKTVKSTTEPSQNQK